MAEEENQREADEERMIRLSAPAVLDDEALKAVMTEDIASNRPEYMAEVAERHGLDLERDAAAVRDTVYEEQLGVIVETCIANALDENTIDSYALLQRACYFSPEDIAYMNAAEGENLSANIAKYIEERLSGVKVLTAGDPLYQRGQRSDFVFDRRLSQFYLLQSQPAEGKV